MSLDTVSRALAIAPDAVRPPLARRLRGYGAFALAILAVAAMTLTLDVDPAVFGKGLESMGRFLGAMLRPTDGGLGHRIFEALIQTFAMAIIATLLAAVIALPLGVLGARSVLRGAWLHFALRRFLDVFRGIPSLVWALILVSALGLGPLAGVLAMAFADIPNLSKLFAEAIENVDEGQREAVRSGGAGEVAALRFGVLPQVAPVMASQSLFFLEGNFRNAAVLGIVGAGGVGLELEERIRVFAFDQVAYILILYILCVMALDYLSAAIRRRLD